MADEPAVAERLAALLDQLAAERPGPMVAVSSLAEGADRLLTRLVLERRGGALVAILPFEVEEYEHDFEGAASRLECRILLSRAEAVEVVPDDPEDPSREAAYERAGRAVLAGCEVLVALWDGGPSRGRGGTAELVAEARRSGHDVRVIEVAR
jgi:hypothetical protein